MAGKLKSKKLEGDKTNVIHVPKGVGALNVRVTGTIKSTKKAGAAKEKEEPKEEKEEEEEEEEGEEEGEEKEEEEKEEEEEEEEEKEEEEKEEEEEEGEEEEEKEKEGEEGGEEKKESGEGGGGGGEGGGGSGEGGAAGAAVGAASDALEAAKKLKNAANLLSPEGIFLQIIGITFDVTGLLIDWIPGIGWAIELIIDLIAAIFYGTYMLATGKKGWWKLLLAVVLEAIPYVDDIADVIGWISVLVGFAVPTSWWAFGAILAMSGSGATETGGDAAASGE